MAKAISLSTSRPGVALASASVCCSAARRLARGNPGRVDAAHLGQGFEAGGRALPYRLQFGGGRWMGIDDAALDA